MVVISSWEKQYFYICYRYTIDSLKLKHQICVKRNRLSHFLIDSILLYRFTDLDEYLFIPEGCFELIFELNGSTQQSFMTSGNWFKRPGSFIGGLHNEAYLVRPLKRNQYSIGIKLRPNITNALFKENLNQYKNQIIDIRDVLNSSYTALIKTINNQSSFDTICRLIVYNFNSNFRNNTLRKNQISVSEIIERKGRVSISELAKNANLSESHYRKLFRETIGLSPREYSKIIRVNNAIHYLKKYRTDSLTKAALALDYFDQSHFIKEFKSVINLTPSTFLV